MSTLAVIQQIDREGPGIFLAVADELDLQVSICRPSRGDTLPTLNNKDILLLLGGPMGIRDIKYPRYNWLSNEIELVKYCFSKHIPVLGICLGAQLIAKAAGGDIVSMTSLDSSIKGEIGWAPIYPFDCSDSFTEKLFPFESLDVLHWHEDRIVLPSSSRLLAYSDKCREQMFAIGCNIYGLQFHPEVTDEMVECWINEDKQFIEKDMGTLATSKLRSQQLAFSSKSFDRRYEFIRTLLSELIN